MIVSPSIGVMGALGGLAIVVAMAGPSPSGTHPDAPPPAHTGGFGEPTCQVCHAEYGLDPEGMRVLLVGVPVRVEPESVHRIGVVVRAEGTVVAGFQLAARRPDGRQAGRLRAVDDRVRITIGDTPAGEVSFAHQTALGTEGESRVESRWTVEWTAPGTPTDVVWNVAGNSANGDNSPFGDLVGLASAGTQVR
ncbi:MAG: choice-of-anchor V domain-containing protein [Longimicrobiales bacterium]|nr:choice-of-anchor V domain-containing protein [Longimicrobiales bacterium]